MFARAVNRSAKKFANLHRFSGHARNPIVSLGYDLHRPSSLVRYCSTTTSSDASQRHVNSMSDSLIEKTINLSKDPKLRDLFSNTWGEVRVGLIFEELDRLAGAVAYKHALGKSTEVVGLLETTPSGESPGFANSENATEKLPIVIVTASVDSIIFSRPLAITNDLRITGRVVLVGRSSMEVLLEVDSVIAGEQKGEYKIERAVEAHFTMVARSPSGDRSITIPDLQPKTEEEWSLYKRAQEARKTRKLSLETSIFTKSPLPEEHELLHQLFYSSTQGGSASATIKSTMSAEKNPSLPQPFQVPQTEAKASKSSSAKKTSQNNLLSERDDIPGIRMENTFRSSVFVMQPQKRNIHNKVFGGYLMRLAFEQAWCSAYIFSGSRPFFLACDDISFLLPVPLGTLVTFDSTVVFSKATEDGRFEIVVEVKANVLHPDEHTHQTTNTFFLFFRVPKCDLLVVPTSYQESMKWLDGKRRLDAITQHRFATKASNKSKGL